MADETMKIWISDELKKQLTVVASKDQLSGVLTAVENNTARIVAQGKEVEGIRSSLRTLEMEANDERRSFDARVRRLINESANAPGTNPLNPAGTSNALPLATNQKSQERLDEEGRMYEKARRSLRIWPLKGSSDGELLAAVQDFCSNALLLPASAGYGIKSVARVRSSPRSHSFLEVVVVFEDNYHRDRVLSSGPKLAGYRDENGRPTCGLRLQIPGHLMTQFKVLENFAFSKKKDFGGKIKKHIKFDEAGRCLFLQMKHIVDDEEWSDFSFEQARDEQKKRNEKRVKKWILLQSPVQQLENRTQRKNSFSSVKNVGPGSFQPPSRHVRSHCTGIYC